MAAQLKQQLDRLLGRKPNNHPAVYARHDAVFRAKRDGWATCMVFGIAVAVGVVTAAVASYSTSTAIKMFAAMGGFFIGGLGLYFWGTTYYYLTETDLHLRSGCFHARIPLTTVRGIEPKRWAWGISYAWSLNVLQIETSRSRWRYLIAPLDREAFIQALRARCPHLS